MSDGRAKRQKKKVLTRNRSATPPSRNQNRMINPDILTNSTQVLINPPNKNQLYPNPNATPNSTHSQQIPPRPPERKYEKRRQDQTGDLARIRIEPARDQRGAD
jgi:hypothetical protein